MSMQPITDTYKPSNVDLLTLIRFVTEVIPHPSNRLTLARVFAAMHPSAASDLERQEYLAQTAELGKIKYASRDEESDIRHFRMLEFVRNEIAPYFEVISRAHKHVYVPQSYTRPSPEAIEWLAQQYAQLFS